MLGYRDQSREWLGKFPARFDDVFNFIPARLTGLFIVLSAPFCKASFQNAWKIMWRDSSQTASPNAGVPMSAMAGALDIELAKVNHYRLGKDLRSPEFSDLLRSRKILFLTVFISAFVLAFVSSFILQNSSFPQ